MDIVRRLIVEARGVPPGSRRASIAPGKSLRVGRTSMAEFQIPDDEALSQEHWEVEWDGQVCQVRDLGTPTGLFVGGEKKDSAVVRSGAWVRAGKTDFSIFVEGAAPPAAPLPPDRAVRADAAFSFLSKPQDLPLFALLDGARNDRILSLLRTSVDDFVSLYDGLRAEVEEDGAPYLVKFSKNSLLLPQLVQEGWGDSWGVFANADVTLRELRAHLRRQLVVTREKDDQPMYFRFYDPRVLRSFLPIATPRQSSAFFGPISRFVLEDAQGEVTTFNFAG
ncbi:MAG: DUF4123 domain-containing protein [Polyangiaceae bacterium]|nr:DUF4123 domain-containing protein [Polyangiaceae bacterium]